MEETALFMRAEEAGLTPAFVKHQWYGKEFRCGSLITECWGYDLSSASIILQRGLWSEEWNNQLVEAIKRLPDMINSLHLLGIVHRDLYSRNIVVRRNSEDNGWDIALIDFGMSWWSTDSYEQDKDFRQLQGTVHWVSQSMKRPICLEMPAEFQAKYPCESCRVAKICGSN
jgi:tRNA A-37 threonylcarbamoyl transferase component Bud32